jgi:hypothetical protein
MYAKAADRNLSPWLGDYILDEFEVEKLALTS